MRGKLLSLVAGGLASVSGLAGWSASAVAQEPRTAVPVQTAISTDAGSVPVQLVDHRRYHRGWRGYRNGWSGYYDYGYYPGYRSYSYPRYYSYGYPRYAYPYRSYYSSYSDPYYYPSGTVYFSW